MKWRDERVFVKGSVKNLIKFFIIKYWKFEVFTSDVYGTL